MVDWIAVVDDVDRPRQLRISFENPSFWKSKRALDLLVCVLCLPFVAVLALAIAAMNPFLNPGPLLFVQVRMGKDCRPFRMIKFRTMLPGGPRGPEDPIEASRVTSLGRWLRRTRLDETPQFVNVLAGQMSLIGPRPDIYEHGLCFVETVPRYRQRYAVRPGITGLAQVALGYVEGSSLAERKVRKDILYIRRTHWRLELAIALRTVAVMCSGFGAK